MATVPNSFITLHNSSLTPGVFFIRMSGSTKEYRAILDRRTHSLFIFTDSTVGQRTMVQINSEKSMSKLIHVLRDKFEEAERTFIPRYFNSVVAYEEYNKMRPTEVRPATIVIKENRPVYTLYPTFAVKGHPLLTLLLRIKPIFDFVVTQSDLLDIIMSPRVSSNATQVSSDGTQVANGLTTVPRENILTEIVKRSGEMVLNDIRAIKTRSVTIPDLMDKVESLIPFEPFTIIDESRFIVAASELDELLKTYDRLPPYIIVEGSPTSRVPGYRVMTVVEKDGTLHEVLQDSSITVVPGTLAYTAKSFDTSDVQYVMLSMSEPLPSVAPQPITVSGTYTPPAMKQEIVMPFRTPVSCKAASLDDDKPCWDYPCLVQRKLDGNRTIVYSLLGGKIIRYYSRSGYQLSKNFNTRFNQDIASLTEQVCTLIGKPDANIHFDFECYTHGVIHEVIAGLCNAVQLKEGFDSLKLHLLSWFCFDDIYTYEERKRKYTASKPTFGQMISSCQSLEMDYETIVLNETRLISSQDELKHFMKESVTAGYEGLIIYPPNAQYVFGHDRLVKLKKIFDGEVRVIGYKESPTEQGAIGSVLVESRPYLGVRMPGIPESKDTISYYVTASLKLEHRAGSMNSPLFQQCLYKYFTIICDSFSQTGIPMHSRFKSQLHPSNARSDVDGV